MEVVPKLSISSKQYFATNACKYVRTWQLKIENILIIFQELNQIFIKFFFTSRDFSFNIQVFK